MNTIVPKNVMGRGVDHSFCIGGTMEDFVEQILQEKNKTEHGAEDNKNKRISGSRINICQC